MQTTTRPSTRRTKARTVTEPLSHRWTDIGAISTLVAALILFAALVFGEAGQLGSFLKEAFSAVFGRVVWVAPVGLLVVSAILFMGKRSSVRTPHLLVGTLLILLAILGGFARERGGEWFDPVVVPESGGYIGALVAATFSWAFGKAWFIGIGALGMVGIVLCRDLPLREVFAGWRAPELPGKKRSEVRVTGPQAPDTAVVIARDRNVGDPTEPIQAELPLGPITRKPAKEKAAPRFIDTTPMEFSKTDAPMPKEGYSLPALSILREPTAKPKRSAEEMQRNIEILENTLDQFNIEANVVEVATGPTITRYEIQLGAGVRVGRITALADNIAMNLAARSVRVEAPIPGKAAIGVEVPNSTSSMVTLREVCATPEMVEHKSRLLIGLGQDVAGVNRYADLTKMPHLLIGGATNSGKSIGLATIITSLLLRNTPKDVRMVMIDPKRVELSLFDGIPHLLCPVIKDVKEAPGVLRAVWREMDIRYDMLSQRGVRNIDGWNEKASFAEKLPYIVVIIDELADLMIQAKAEVETSIVRLAQLARAVGIHLVIATQRPSVDVITGLIKANVPSRIAFAVSSQIDSRTILDQSGAEDLVGRGDMLFMPFDANKPTRIQGCYVSEDEIERVCDHWKAQEMPNYTLEPIGAPADTGAVAGDRPNTGENDALFEDAVRWVVERGQASTSMIQRRFAIGFQRASRLLDLMEERGIVGPRDGPRPREVLIDIRDVDALFGLGQAYDGPDLAFMDEDE